MNKTLQEYKSLLIQKRYSQNTINIYCKYFLDFLNNFSDVCLAKVSKEQINAYILHLIQSEDISPSQQNQRINAIKFYYEKILGREKQYYDLHRPKKEYRLPKVLSKNEIKRIFDSCTNMKHKCILMLIYSAGLRRSELIELKISDIDSERMVITIRGAKERRIEYHYFQKMLWRCYEITIKSTGLGITCLKGKRVENTRQQAWQIF